MSSSLWPKLSTNSSAEIQLYSGDLVINRSILGLTRKQTGSVFPSKMNVEIRVVVVWEKFCIRQIFKICKMRLKQLETCMDVLYVKVLLVAM